uniref:Uncharacterized protein n=1 Tax=Pavo cristatus TaxID=9049 RepID=A0A8C9F1U3_PAVCR
MAVTHGEGLLGPPPLVALAVLALLGGLVYLCTLCAACRRYVPARISPLQSMLRQTQLRSLSKSDTRLHELYRLKAKDSSECAQSLSIPPHTLCAAVR